MNIFHIDFHHELVKNNKLKAISRFIIWQVKSRMFRRDFVHNWVEESKFYVKNGETGLTQNIYVGLAEFEDMSFLLHLLQEDDYFIDIGANSGSYSILGGAVTGARVVAVEPVRETYERLVRNLILNCLEGSSTALNVGLGSKFGFLSITSALDTINQIVIGETHNVTTQVEITTLDEIAKNLDPALIKIDVEGWETEVLIGGFKTLQNPGLLGLIMELNESGLRYGFSDSEILKILSGFGFAPYSYSPISRSLKRLEGKNSKGGNTIFIRNEVEVLKRIKGSPRRKILGVSI
jgi:FkbM family methyltransferase